MCGRYSLVDTPGSRAWIKSLGIDPNDVDWRYNIAPTQFAHVVQGLDGQRKLTRARWGFIPHWADPRTFKQTLINARAETADSKASFRDALRRTRCIVPASHYFEWQQGGGGKQPFAIKRIDGLPLLLGGLWSQNRRGPEPAQTFTVLTTEVNALVRKLHDRMPLILDPASVDRWLDPTVEDVQDLLVPGNAELEAYPVTKDVGNVHNDGRHLIEPLSPPS